MCVCLWFSAAGEEAADFLQRDIDVDVMLLDIRMPGKSGVDVVRTAARPLRYPIIAMTGHVDNEAQEEFRSEFWDDAIDK